MKKILCVLLVLASILSLLVANALAEADFTEDEITEAFSDDDEDAIIDEEIPDPFTFRNGITWGMTQQAVLEAEGNPKYETDHDDVTEKIEIEDVEFGGAKCDIEYAFSNDDLFMVTVEYDDDAPVSFDDLRTKLVERFGEPGDFSDEIKAELSEEELAELGTIASWTLADGTEVWLLEDTDDQSIEIMFVDLGW